MAHFNCCSNRVANCPREIDRFVNPTAGHKVGLDLLGEIASDAAVRDAVLKRRLLLETSPGSPVAVAFNAPAGRLVP